VNHVTPNNANVTPQNLVLTKVLALKIANQSPGENGEVMMFVDVQLVRKWLKNVNVLLLLPHQSVQPPQYHHHNALTKLDAPELWENNGTTLVMLATLALASKTV
jgi:hypothetical protein